MCGIAGYVDFSSNGSGSIPLGEMLKSIASRGPDDRGTIEHHGDMYRMGLGHNRLSILDLTSSGRQPISFGGLTIVYNGEVYNFREIRIELEAENYMFETQTDTEVVLKAFHRWGVNCVHKFNGMFSFCVWDQEKNKLHLIRDRAGVKPVYWHYDNNLFLFASELKSFSRIDRFPKNIDRASLRAYIQLGFIPHPSTIFEKTYKISPGYRLELNLADGAVSHYKYWDINDFYTAPRLKLTYEEACDELENMLTRAFQYRMVSDVPVGVFLSGGYDSASVAAILAQKHGLKLRTFTIGFEDDEFDESEAAYTVANCIGSDHAQLYCREEDAIEIVPYFSEIFDEPFADPSAIPTFLLCRWSRESVKVALSADGGDELLGGYEKYQRCLQMLKLNSGIPSLDKRVGHFLKASKNLFPQYSKINSRLERIANSLIDVSDISPLLHSLYPSQEYVSQLVVGDGKFNYGEYRNTFCSRLEVDQLDALLATDFKTYLTDDVLTKVDRTSMSVSLESREPFLDKSVIEFCASLPSEYKLGSGVGKRILKDIVHRHLPQKIMDRPKKGFGVPLTAWLAGGLQELVLHYLEEGKLSREGFFNICIVSELKKRLQNTHKNDMEAKVIWRILIFELWYEKWIS